MMRSDASWYTSTENSRPLGSGIHRNNASGPLLTGVFEPNR
jgi:hypothetical protein